ncbi:MAG: hypothetical protein AAF518_04055 [Spirochaetota bacterium]
MFDSPGILLRIHIAADLQVIWQKICHFGLHQKWNPLVPLWYASRSITSPEFSHSFHKSFFGKNLLQGEATGEFLKSSDVEILYSFRFAIPQKNGESIQGNGHWHLQVEGESTTVVFWLSYKFLGNALHALLDRAILRFLLEYYLRRNFSILKIYLESSIHPKWVRLRSYLQCYLRVFLASYWMCKSLNLGQLYTGYPMLKLWSYSAFLQKHLLKFSHLVEWGELGLGILLLVLPERRWLYLLSMLFVLPLFWSLAFWGEYMGVLADTSFSLYITLFLFSFLGYSNSKGLPRIYFWDKVKKSPEETSSSGTYAS